MQLHDKVREYFGAALGKVCFMEVEEGSPASPFLPFIAFCILRVGYADGLTPLPALHPTLPMHLLRGCREQWPKMETVCSAATRLCGLRFYPMRIDHTVRTSGMTLHPETKCADRTVP